MEEIKYIYEEGEGITYEYKTYPDGDNTIHELWSSSSGIFIPDFRNNLLYSLVEHDDGVILPKVGGWVNYADAHYFGLLLMLASGVDFKKIKLLKEA